MRQIAYGGGQMERREYVIYSSHLKKDMHIIQYGHSGLPIIGFPTQCAPCTNYEDFGATRVLEPYFEEGQMQLFCVETVDGESWCCKDGINTWRSARQESYHRFIVDEVIPFIQKFYTQGMRPFVIGVDLGATQAAITFFRRPELFCGLVALSGIYDSSVYYHGWMNSTLYDNSVECFLANMPSSAFSRICRRIIPGSESTTVPLFLCAAEEEHGRTSVTGLSDTLTKYCTKRGSAP